MNQGRTLALRLTGILLIMIVPVFAFANTQGIEGVNKEALMKKVSGLQMPFIENQGQIKDKSVKFYANTFAGTVYVTDKCEIVYRLQKTDNRTQSTEHRQKTNGLKPQDTISKAVAIKESLQCAKITDIKGIDRSVTKANYFIGSKDKWRTDIPTWNEVSLGKVYKGIELKLRAYGNNVEKLFTVYPEGTVSDIKLKTEGAKGIKVNKAGELEIETTLGVVKMTKPVAYQEINGKRVQVTAKYILPDSKLTYGFQVGKYDRTKPLVIDPLLASTFVGGANKDATFALAIDSIGNVFIAGYTTSSDYPVTEGAYDATHNGGTTDGFISKLDTDLSSLVSSTFIGGSGYDYAWTLAIDSSGNVFVAGVTTSSDYPATDGAYDTSFNGYYDVIISKLDSDLSSLLSSTFIGESELDYASALAIDPSGNVFIAGRTTSSDYPITDGAYDTLFNGYADVIISKLDSDLSSLLSSTFIGGSGSDYAYALAIDSSGNVFVAGGTASTDYPITDGAYDTSFNGYADVIISKLDSDLSSLLSSTFIGGSGSDNANALAIDSSGNVFVAGGTWSTDYPVTDGAFDTTHNGGYYDVFISKLNSDLSSFLSSTFVGGGDSDSAYALAIDSSGNVFIAGDTYSTDYPTTDGAYDNTFPGNGGSYDAFISKLDSDLSEDPADPDIKANGSDGPITITHHDTLSVTISLSPGTYDGEDADWWILMETPSGWYHYNFENERWQEGIAVSDQGPLYEIDTLELWVKPTNRKGEYTYYFKVDTDMNGEMDEDLLYEDSVVVEVTKK